jgi:hypothetical protein
MEFSHTYCNSTASIPGAAMEVWISSLRPAYKKYAHPHDVRKTFSFLYVHFHGRLIDSTLSCRDRHHNEKIIQAAFGELILTSAGHQAHAQLA